jgi:hypothetical protein
MGECLWCRVDIEHCHGAVIHHALRRSECTEDDCVTPEVMHAFSIDCDAIGCGCAQPMGSTDERASSTG